MGRAPEPGKVGPGLEASLRCMETSHITCQRGQNNPKNAIFSFFFLSFLGENYYYNNGPGINSPKQYVV